MKKLRQFSHKSVSPAWGRLLYTLFLVMTLSMVFVQPAFAADTIWSKASEIMQDVYNQILLISTIAAIVTASVAPVSYTHLDVYKRQRLAWKHRRR